MGDQLEEYKRMMQERHRKSATNTPRAAAAPPQPVQQPTPPPPAPQAYNPPPPNYYPVQNYPPQPQATTPPPPASSYVPMSQADQDEMIARRLQEEEDAQFNTQMSQDEEIARKLQYNDENVRPPIDVVREERMVDPLPVAYPVDPQQYGGYSSDPNAPLLQGRTPPPRPPTQPTPTPQDTGPAGPGCLGSSDDNSKRVCGIRTPFVIFGIAGLMVIGIIVGMVLLS